MNQRNYQRELEKIIRTIEDKQSLKVPKVFLHSCCAPCSSYCLEYLSNYFEVTVFYYNPNIYPEEEYRKRVVEQQEFIKKFPAKFPISFVEGEYDTKKFYDTVKGMEQLPEGGERCFACYRLRLQEAYDYAKDRGFDYFTTTLTISPLKNAAKLNEIGEEIALAGDGTLRFLPSDFKKKNGYKRSVELSEEYGMYRQNYCGCVFSQQERERQDSKNVCRL